VNLLHIATIAVGNVRALQVPIARIVPRTQTEPLSKQVVLAIQGLMITVIQNVGVRS
jgi:hypothetical protein